MKKEKRSKMSGIWFFQRIRRKLVELEYDNVLTDNSSEFMNVIICLKSLKEKDRIRCVPCVMMTWMPEVSL